MENDYLLFNVFKDRGLLTGLIISLLTHFLLFINLPIKEDKLLGDKYVPIEIVDIKSPIIKGDSINQSEKTINKNVSNKDNNFKQKSEEKLEKKIDNNKFEDFKKETLNKKVEDSSLNKNTSQQNQLENEKKIRGIEKGIKSNTTETGSILKGLNRIENDNSIEPEIKKELIALLSPADSNKDGRLSKDEITLAINSFFDGNDNFTVEKLYDLIDYYFDQN